MKALVIGAHLDDSVIALGGTIRKIVEAGGEVNVVCFGHSDEDFAVLSDKDSAAERITAEALEAHKVLGVKSFECFHYPDYAVQENRETYRLCIESIRKYEPDIIFGHSWNEYFQHRAMARLSCDSWWQAGWSCSADLGKPWFSRSLYHFEVIQLLSNPTDIVDISNTFEAKIAAWRCFQANAGAAGTTLPNHEGSAKNYGSTMGSLTEQLETRARYYGSVIGVRYGEALQRSDFLPRPVRDVALL